MVLYRMELNKLLCRKSILFGGLAVLGILVLYFTVVCVGEERTTVNGTLYTGLEAVRKDREITEEFRGKLTDSAARQIVTKYGFPTQVEEYYGRFRDENYLNGFITEYLGNGYFRSWDDYQLSDSLLPLNETELGRAAAEASGGRVLLEYGKGWYVFFDMLQLGMILISVLMIVVISPVFAEEHQTRMAALLFTSKYGRTKDIAAKTAAAFTAAAFVYLLMLGFLCVTIGLVYGFDGKDCMSGTVLMRYGLDTARSFDLKPVGTCAVLMLSMDFLAICTLCAVILCVSAHQRTSFHAVVVSCAVWAVPLLIRILFDGAGYLLASGTPMFLIMTGVLSDWNHTLFIPAGMAAGTLFVCLWNGWNTCRMSQVLSR